MKSQIERDNCTKICSHRLFSVWQCRHYFVTKYFGPNSFLNRYQGSAAKYVSPECIQPLQLHFNGLVNGLITMEVKKSNMVKKSHHITINHAPCVHQYWLSSVRAFTESIYMGDHLLLQAINVNASYNHYLCSLFCHKDCTQRGELL